MKITMIAAAMIILSITPSLARAEVRSTHCRADAFGFAPYDPPAPVAGTDVDLVICLDTSGSMTNLIDSARAKLWDIVNEIGAARPTPRLRVGLLTYGSPHLSTASQGWVVRQLDLTSDLDTVYAKMMSMTTNGGDEFVGWVLNDAVRTMSWSHDPSAVKLIFVAGNESADQAANQFNFRHVAEVARSKDITINAIYAGNRRQGIQEHWDQVGLHGGGSYAAIDMKQGTIQIASPHDSILIQLNAQLNATYIPFGSHGRAGAHNQKAQDRNAEGLGVQSCGSRIAAKATAVYRNERWDLVDAARDKDFKIEAVATQDLPKPMQSLDARKRKVYVETMRSERETIQRKIQEVSETREKFLKKERAKRGGGKRALDDAIRASVRRKLRERGFNTPGDK